MAKKTVTGEKTAKEVEPKNYVQATAKMLELAKIGSALNLRVYQRNMIVGQLKVGLKGLWWIPQSWHERKAKRVPWAVLSQMMKEWPFGAQHGVRVQFRNGSVYWRAKPSGPLRRVLWDIFKQRMEMPLLRKQAPKSRSRNAVAK